MALSIFNAMYMAEIKSLNKTHVNRGSNIMSTVKTFKAGDLVRYIGTSFGSFTNGNLYTVREYPTMRGSVGIVEDNEGSRTNGMHPSKWELVEPVPSLQGLRNKALKALDDGVLVKVTCSDGRLVIHTDRYSPAIFRPETILDGYKWIECLYIETFKVETAEDLQRIKEGATGYLLNGIKFNILNKYLCALDLTTLFVIEYNEDSRNYTVDFNLLKGATITQARG